MLPSGHTTQTPIGAKGNKLSKCWSLIGFEKSTVSDPLTSGRLNSHVLVCFVETETFFLAEITYKTRNALKIRVVTLGKK